jgi:hypothetical protein
MTEKRRFSKELTTIIHRILDVCADKIQLQQVPNWPRDSLPKSPLVHKLSLIVIPILYPWWTQNLDLHYEQFGPVSNYVTECFEELLEEKKCQVVDNQMLVQPPSLEEKATFPEITEIFLDKIIRSSNNPILTQFENLELFSIISVEQAQYFADQEIRRQMFSITEKDRIDIGKRVFKRMREISHLDAFINDRGSKSASNYVLEAIDWFYEAVSLSVNSMNNVPSISSN